MLNLLMNILFSKELLSSLFGTIIGAILAYWIALRQFKIQKEAEIQQKQVETTLSFYQELTSNDFSFARVEARKIFDEHFTANSLDNFYWKLPEEKRKYIRMVIAYFRRLQLNIEYKQINKQMVLDLLLEEFFWWHFTWLDEMIPEEWEARKNIDKLHYWFQNAMPSEKYEHSKRVAIKRREKYLLDLRSNQQSNS